MEFFSLEKLDHMYQFMKLEELLPFGFGPDIIGVDEKTQLINSKELVKPNSKRQIYLNLIGEIVDDKFQFGVSKMPLIFSTVYISDAELFAKQNINQ